MPRRYDTRRCHKLFKLIGTDLICVYCGARGVTIDHFVPQSVVSALIGIADTSTGRFLVRACGECNALAGDRIFPTIAAKRRYIHGKIRRKYRRLLAIPHWTETDIDTLSYNLATFVRSGKAQKEWIEARLSWRNTSNKDAVSLAEIRFKSGAFGHGSARSHAKTTGTRRNAARP